MNAPARRGLTIIEVLTVLGIISALMALAGGAAISVSREARSSECRSNLRQLAVATESYRNVNRGELPPAVLYFDGPGGSVETRTWDIVQTADGEIKAGPVAVHLGGLSRVQQCPDFQGPSTFGADPWSGYNYNTTYLGAEGQLPWTNHEGKRLQGWGAARRGLPASTHRKSDRCILFGDGGWRNGANKFMRAPMNSVEYDIGRVYAGAQAYRHGGCTNVACLDGHTECVTEQFEGRHAQAWLLETIMDFPENGFLSDDDAAYDPR